MGSEIEVLKLLGWVGLIVWGLATPIVTIVYWRAVFRGAGPLVWDSAVRGVLSLCEPIVYLYSLYHLQSWIAQHSVRAVLIFVILRGLVFLGAGLWLWRRRRRHGASGVVSDA